jgi:hypothetical protein
LPPDTDLVAVHDAVRPVRRCRDLSSASSTKLVKRERPS